MNPPLFRPEVTQAHGAAWLGAIRIGHNPRFAVVAAVALALAAALAVFAVEGQAEREADGAHRRVALAQKNVERYQSLAQAGFVADTQAQQRQDEWLDLQGRADAARRGVAALERELQSLQAEHRSTGLQGDTDRAQLDRSATALAQERTEAQARQALVVLAPKAGVLTALHVHAGASAQAGQPVWLRYAAYPYQMFGMARGEVSNVSRTPVSPQELPPGQAQALMAAAQSNEPLYRIRVRLARQDIDAYGAAQAIKPGMALEADVIQDRRAVWEWVLEPLVAAGARWKVLGDGVDGSIGSLDC